MLLAIATISTVSAQQDPWQKLNKELQQKTTNVVGLTFEERTRWEEKDGVNFSSSPNQQDMLSRLRIGAQVKPIEWLKIYVVGQDARAPFYGVVAPNTVRDTLDLQEAYVHLFDERKTGFGASFGREMLNYGDTRVIGAPQWANVARTFDNGRLYYRTAKTRFEILMVSPVKVLPDQFNKPEFGERIWGAYDTLSSVWRGASLDVYALRHSQNKIGGWKGAGTLGTDSFGGRAYGQLPHKFSYSLEGIGQTGHIGLLTQRAFAWFAGVSRQVTLINRPLNLSVEYKEASGTEPGSISSGTYDQLAAANHDKFGHQDLFGWRNLKTFKSLVTLKMTKSLDLNLMYSDERLFSRSDALYNILGSPIVLSKTGTAGTHVGQELDSFLTYSHHAHLFGAGFGHFFKGEFIENTTPHINPRYFYVFQQYSFK